MNIVATVIFSCIYGIVSGADWGYTGSGAPDKWATLKQAYGACDDSSQSPIDIPGDSSSVQFDGKLAPFSVTGTSPVMLRLINNGHTVQLDINGNVMVAGGMLQNKHHAAQLHFHWGESNNVGSEHTRGGSHYPLEMHVVTYNTKYHNLSTAVDKSDGLAVLGFWFKVSATDNSKFANLFNSIKQVMNKDDETPISNVNLDDLIPSTLNNYFRYKGSLTTPPCYESVTWTVFDEPLPISEKQLNLFRSVYETAKADSTQHHIGHNYRPVLKLNGRQITRSFSSGSVRCQAASSIVTVIVVFLLSIFH